MDHGGLMASVVLDEPFLGLSPVLVTEIFPLPDGRGRDEDYSPRPAVG